MALIPGAQDLPLFIATGLLLNLTPGPDSLLIVTRAAQHGWRAGVAASTGVSLGICLHVAAGAFGLAALLAASPRAFGLFTLAAAACLVVLGLRLVREGARAVPQPAPAVAPAVGAATGGAASDADAAAPAAATAPASPSAPPAPPTLGRLLAQGFLTNALNPKIAVFFLAFVPPFIAADAPSKALTFVLLGAVFNLGAWLWGLVLALGAGAAGARLAPAPAAARGLRLLTGLAFVFLGLRLALG